MEFDVAKLSRQNKKEKNLRCRAREFYLKKNRMKRLRFGVVKFIPLGLIISG